MFPNLGDTSQEWWQAVETVAGMVACGFDMGGDEDALRAELMARAFSEPAIDEALRWLDQVLRSGTIVDVMDMILPAGAGPRVAHPVEKVLMSDKLWRLMERWRSHGIIGTGMAERMLESMRSMDTRDWEDDEIRDFIAEVVRSSTLPGADARFGKGLRGHKAELYS